MKASRGTSGASSASKRSNAVLLRRSAGARLLTSKSETLSLVTDAATSARLARIRQKDTAAEQSVRRILHALGLRFRIRNRDLPGAPDAANRAHRWAVFVHGCFWHSHAGCYRATVPKRNRDFWLTKFQANRARDARALRQLRRHGYRAVVVWECELDDAERLARRLRVLARRLTV